MRSKKKMIPALLAVAALAVVPALFHTAMACDGNKDAKAATASAKAGTGCDKAAHAAQNAEMTHYGCPKAATRAAVAALQKHAGEIDCAESKAMIAKAVKDAEEAQATTGCAKMRAAAEQAALVEMKNVAQKVGCPEATAAINEAQALLASNEEPAEAEKVAEVVNN